MKDIQVALSGDSVMERRYEPVPMSIEDRVSAIVRSHWNTTAAPTGTNQRAYEIAAEEFGTQLEKLRQLVEVDLKSELETGRRGRRRAVDAALGGCRGVLRG